MKYDNDFTGERSFWQALEYCKRCYQALEQHDFAVGVDYDTIFKQIDKELGDECRSPN